MSKRQSPWLSKVRVGAFSGLALLAAQGRVIAEPADPSGPIRGVVRPQRQATISTDFQASVAAAKFKEGDRFRKGDVLIEFDCRRHQAELAAAEAQTLEMRLALENNVTLDKYKAVGKSDLEISRARVKRTEADASGLRARLDQCKVVAPFDGRIAELGIHEHEMPAPGKPFLTIIEDQKLEIELIVPSEWLKWLKPETTFVFAIDETLSAFPARVSRIGAAVDPVSQTVKVMGFFDADAAASGILSGMSGAAQFDEPRG